MKTEIFEVKAGVAVPMESEDLLTVKGRVEPVGDEVVTIPAKWGFSPRRIALYPKGSVTPFPLAAAIKRDPKSFGVEDLKNLLGKYLPHLMRRALRVEDDSWSIRDWVILGISALSLLTSGITLYFVYKGFKAAGLL